MRTRSAGAGVKRGATEEAVARSAKRVANESAVADASGRSRGRPPKQSDDESGATSTLRLSWPGGIISPAPLSSPSKAIPKFHPLPNLKKVDHNVPIVDGIVPRGSTILIIQQPWIGLLLDGHKTLEIRGQACKKPKGEKVHLALSGGGGIILGQMTFVASHGPLSRAEYKARCERHCVWGDTLPYGSSTYAWEFKGPMRFRRPVPYVHQQGCVVWAVKD